MANILINSQFKPFSMQEMLAPVLMADTEHKALEESLGELLNKSDIWDKLANEQDDPYAYNLYKKYSTDLSNTADILAREGLNPNSRLALIDMRGRYNKEIVPLELAYNRRQLLTDEYRKLKALDNTLLFDRDPSLFTISELVKNPTLAPKSYSGALLTKQVGLAALLLSKQMMNNPRLWRSILGNQYYETLMQRGFNPLDVLLAMLNNPNASPILQGMVEDAVNSSGIRDWQDESNLNRAYEYARQGLWNAVGDTLYLNLTNKAYDYAMKLSLLLSKASSKGKGDASNIRLSYSAIPKLTINEDTDTTKLKEAKNFLQLLKNDKSILDKPLRSEVNIPMFGPFSTQRSRSVEYPARDKLKELTTRYNTTNLDEIDKLIDEDIKMSAVRNFRYMTNLTDNTLMNQDISRVVNAMAIGDRELPVKELKSNGKIGDNVDRDDFMEYIDLKKGNLVYDDNIGIIYTGVKDGKHKEFVLDTELFDQISPEVSDLVAAIEEAKRRRDRKNYPLLIRLLFDYLDARYNNVALVLGNTSSKVSVGDESFDETYN